MMDIITTSREEQDVCGRITQVDNWLMSLRDTIRRGEIVEELA
jgi:hypothetical protein